MKLFRDIRLKNIKTRQDELETQLAILEGFVNKSNELLRGGLEVEICNSAGSLCSEAENLIKSQTESDRSQQPAQIDVDFSAATMPDIGDYEIHTLGVWLCDGAQYDVSQQRGASVKEKINLNDLYEKLLKDKKSLAQAEQELKKNIAQQRINEHRLADATGKRMNVFLFIGIQ